ncbi:MarR family winged helix-turn-helix transcriptional regulator [Microlunatus kandeliicorticis]|nr:MarR family transcriptional regulator [Microlunatus kandeliicorticis]
MTTIAGVHATPTAGFIPDTAGVKQTGVMDQRTGEKNLTKTPRLPATASRPTEDVDLESATLDALMRASRVVTAIVARSMARNDNRITMPQLRVLVMVASGPDVTTTAVASELRIHLSSASRLCDRLVAAGWLTRRESPTDRRSSLLVLTRRGRSLLSAIMAERRRAFAQIVADLPATQQRTLTRSLERFADAAGEPRTGSLSG